MEKIKIIKQKKIFKGKWRSRIPEFLHFHIYGKYIYVCVCVCVCVVCVYMYSMYGKYICIYMHVCVYKTSKGCIL